MTKVEEYDYDKKKREKVLGFKPQKEIIYNRYLPYAEHLDEESNRMLAEIKWHLGQAVMLREMRPACGIWSSRLARYIQLYGLKFSKEDHVTLVKLMFECLTIPKLEPYFVHKFAQVLYVLLKKLYLLSPDDLELPWRPLYEVCDRIMDSSHTELGMYRYFALLENTLDSLVHVAKNYFPVTATREILDEFKPQLYPLSNNKSDFDIFEWFLPTGLPPHLSHMGYKLWLNNVMEMWVVCGNGPLWESEAFCLIAKLAWANIGLIDWEPHIPVMFQRFISSLNLPVTYKQQQNTKKIRKLDCSATAMWIVSALGGGSVCQNYLNKFLKSIETYFHHANFGRWLMKLKELLWKLSQLFVERLHRERYKKPSWENQIPDSKKLTEEDIDRFVESIKPVAMFSVFSKLGSMDVGIALQHLATLRPKLICQDLIERLYGTLDSVTEPHKLTSLMQCVAGVARPLVRDVTTAQHVLPLLMALLPGLDPNDFRKSIVTFQFVQNFVTLVPLVDCSNASSMNVFELSEEEEILCATTAGFEDFVCQFFERIFLLIENSSLEMTRLDKNDDKLSKLETMAERALTAVCYSVLFQCSPSIFQAALHKLHTFVTERIFETKVAGHLVASVCKSFSRVDSMETMKILVPHLTSTVLRLTEAEDIYKENNLDEELMYNLLILSEIVETLSEGLMHCMPSLTAVLDRCLYFESREANAIAARMLTYILISLTNMTPMEHRSCNYAYKDNDTEHLPVRDWGQPGDFKNLNLEWHWPDEEEANHAQALIDRYVVPELSRLDRHVDGTETMTRPRLLSSLRIVLGSMGAEALMPLWEEEPLILVKSCLPVSQLAIEFGVRKHLKMPDGRNLRLVLAQLIGRLQKYMLEHCEDETKAFLNIIQIWERLLLNKLRAGVDFENHWKSFHYVKKTLEDRLVGRKQTLRNVIIARISLQHEARCEKSRIFLTPTHKMIMLNLFELACSHYSEVRIKAQSVLSQGLDFFPYSYTVLIPKIIENLKNSSPTTHETVKGTLHVMLGPKKTPLVTRHDWAMLLEVWPAVVLCPPSEKLSVIRLVENIKEIVHKNFPTITIQLEIPDSCVEAARMLWAHEPRPPVPPPDAETLAGGRAALLKSNDRNFQLYSQLLNALADAIASRDLHWRQNNVAMCFIRDLVHPDVPYPSRIVQLFLNAIVNESIDIRKIALRSVVHILKQQKRKHPKILVDLQSICNESLPRDSIYNPGVRPDNLWMQYSKENFPKNAEDWDQPRFVHNFGYGYFGWPSCGQIEVYAPSKDQPNLDREKEDLKDEEVPVVEFFSSPDKISQLITYLSLEDKKGKDKFNRFNFILFKGLFRNHGDHFFPLFKPHLERLIADKQESCQRCAAEIIAGVIRGTKNWPYHKVSTLWSESGHNLTGLIRSALANMTEETIGDWGICIATASQNRDPNRSHWLLELLMEEPLKDAGESASLLECGRLYTLQGALNQFDWRVADLNQRLLESILRRYIDHPFENVRLRVASVLASIFQSDVTILGGKTLPPHVADFMDSVMPRLQILHSLVTTQNDAVPEITEGFNKKLSIVSGSEESDRPSHKNGVVSSIYHTTETDMALRLFKTVLLWIMNSLMRNNGCALRDHYRLFPLTCLLEGSDQDEELRPLCSKALATLAQAPFLPQHISDIYSLIEKASSSTSWWSRKTALEFLQVFFFHNMSVIRASKQCSEETTHLVLSRLEDERIEVREKAAEVLAGLLHCDFIDDTASLLASFKKRIKIKGKKRQREQQYEPNQVRLQHSATLGLCSFINAAPYEVPEYVPDIFLILGDHLHDPQPIPSTIRKTLGDFKRTHHENWNTHKLKFTPEQLEVFDHLIVPPSYIT